MGGTLLLGVVRDRVRGRAVEVFKKVERGLVHNGGMVGVVLQIHHYRSLFQICSSSEDFQSNSHDHSPSCL